MTIKRSTNTFKIVQPNKEATDRVTQSFQWAFFTKKLKYCDELVYDTDTKEKMNNPSKLEPK
jgi:hypothetical protein